MPYAMPCIGSIETRMGVDNADRTGGHGVPAGDGVLDIDDEDPVVIYAMGSCRTFCRFLA